MEEYSMKIYSYFLDTIPGIGYGTVHKLITLYDNPRNVYFLSEYELSNLVEKKILTNRQKDSFVMHREQPLGKIYSNLTREGIEIVSLWDDCYPEKLREISVPPVNLYVKGQLPSCDKPAVGIVGARMCSDYGRYVARKYAEKIAEAGIEVISGMAMGIDGIAQRAAISSGGKSYGILGCGVDRCYPESNRPLYDMLVINGGVISEFPPGTEPRSGLFPLRNRIISALSDVLIVVEAREKSGTLITVDRALEQGKEVYAVPGRITDSLSMGCNRLIEQGAEPAILPEKIIDKLLSEHGCYKSSVQSESSPFITAFPEGEDEQFVFSLLDDNGCEINEIYAKSAGKGRNFSVPDLYGVLMKLELSGFVICDNGRYKYCRR